jgi:uncharacterized membrane protein
MSDLIAITYADEASGRGAFEELDRLQKMEVLTLEDAALAIKDQKGKVKVKQTLENAHAGSAAIWGGFWGLLIGLLFLAPIFWGLMGALLGGILGKTTDIGIDNKFIKEVGDSLEVGGSALFMLVAKVAARRCSCWWPRRRQTRSSPSCRSTAARYTRPPCPMRTRPT